MLRSDNRGPDELRQISLTRDWSKHAEGSCLVEFGDTKVLCTASVDDSVPAWLRNSGRGWVTAEYGMLPRATNSRNQRAATRGKADGRAIEIQRLIGRSLRGAIDLDLLGERSVTIDCDVLQADGGTRTAAITGAWVALHDAFGGLCRDGVLQAMPLLHHVAAISVGLVDGHELLDLCYDEDARAQVDMNVVMTEDGRLIEVQAGGEGNTFTVVQLNRMLTLAQGGIDQLVSMQVTALDARAG